MFPTFQKLLSQKANGASTWRVSRLWLVDSRQSIGLALLRIAAVSTQQRIELAPLVQLLAVEHRGFAQHRLERLAKLLEQGTTLVEAVEQSPNLLTDEQILELRLADQSGTTSQTFNTLIEVESQRSRESSDQVLQALFYAVGLLLTVGFVLTFLTLFVSPTYQELFSEFGLRLPQPLVLLTAFTEIFSAYLPIFAMLFVLLAALSWYAQPLRILRRWIWSRLTRSAIELRVAHLLRMLASSMEAGRPLSGALSTLARYHFDRSVQIKLLFARNELEQGASTWQGLAKSHLLTDNEAVAIERASSDSLRAWLIRGMASEKEDRVELRRAFWAMLVHPAIVLFFGFIVLWICTAYFMVLISMVCSLG